MWYEFKRVQTFDSPGEFLWVGSKGVVQYTEFLLNSEL